MTTKNDFLRSVTMVVFSIPALIIIQPTRALAQQLEEVIVTAEKREASAQDLGISISTLSAEDLRSKGIEGVRDLATSVPSIHLGTHSFNEGLEIVIRGIGGSSVDALSDPGVGVHLNGLYLARQPSQDAFFYDVERVEVLRGPQGTLYGRNAAAGVINIITNKPVNRFEASANATYGDYDQVRFRGMTNVPLIEDTLSFRVAGIYDRHDGYTNNTVPGIEDGDDGDDKGVRFSALYTPTDDLSLFVTADYAERGGIGAVRQAIPAPPAEPLEDWDLNTQGFTDSVWWGTSAELNWNINDSMDLAYLFGYRTASQDRLLDSDGTAGPFVVTLTNEEDPDQLSHELRFSSTSERLDWVIGLYLMEEDSTRAPSIDASPAVAFTQVLSDYHVDSKAVFGQASYMITDNIRITGGLRQTWDEKNRDETTFFTAPAVFADPIIIGQAADWDEFTWKVGADWFFDDDRMVYFNVSTGYKSGGFEGGALGQFNQENVLAYQIGSKNEFLDNRLRLNVAGFIYAYDDLQISRLDLLEAGGSFVENAADSTIRGVEIDALFVPNDAFQLDINMGYVNAEFDEFISADPFDPALGNQDLSGNKLIKSPEWTLNAGVQYTWQLANGMEITPRIQTHYESESFLRPFNIERDRQEAYTHTDLFLTVRPTSGNWHLQVYAKNLEDERINLNQISLNPGTTLGSMGPPGTYGVTVGYDWQ